MNRHSSLNRIYRLVWNEGLRAWVPTSENSRGRKKRNGRSATAWARLLASLGLGLTAHALAAGVPGSVSPTVIPPAPTTLPTGGKVVAGTGTIHSSSTADSAVLNVDQTSQRAVINWNTFNLGSAAQVNFNQPGADSATLNRVLDSNPSQIFGKINAPGQVFLTNPNGVYFGKSAVVDVGSLTATTGSIGDADFMAGKLTFERNGATGSVVNEGELHARLGGYIALLAPEVRNSGIIVARMGTVALAAGESVTLNLDGNHLAGISATPSAITALV
jgi:fibronectin-binding autotransporter adhesin